MSTVEDLSRKYKDTYCEFEELGPCLIRDFSNSGEDQIIVYLISKIKGSIEIPLDELRWNSTKFPMGAVNYKDGVAFIHSRAERQWKRGLSRSSHILTSLSKVYLEALNYSGLKLGKVRPLSIEIGWDVAYIFDLFKDEYFSLLDATQLLDQKKKFGVAVSKQWSIFPSTMSKMGIFLLYNMRVVAELNLVEKKAQLISTVFRQEVLDFLKKENVNVKLSG